MSGPVFAEVKFPTFRIRLAMFIFRQSVRLVNWAIAPIDIHVEIYIVDKPVGPQALMPSPFTID